ncbi:hypothetical protein E3T55_16240 [Cryobacterium frigoriphilum]|uniref:Uncharacterized protein n=1 Tax=Cryobacterium frigoriphilum TaxID=1259150 RepID=A0A4R8ZV67_9MICO|nr:hypothetical protein [Cryobacterium frigoriphilum]TFD46922.1 hypothetical protein E3T55_16240 [Cryobacterium frigoriphilum]
MSYVVTGNTVKVRSELLRLRFAEESGAAPASLRQSMLDLEDLLDVAGDLAGEQPESYRVKVPAPRAIQSASSTGFRIRSLRYGSPFDAEIELLVVAGPQLLVGALSVVSVFTALATARLIWKRGDVKTAEAHKLHAQANKANAEAENLRREYRAPDPTPLKLAELALEIMNGNDGVRFSRWLSRAQAEPHLWQGAKTIKRRRGIRPIAGRTKIQQLSGIVRLASKPDAILRIEED